MADILSGKEVAKNIKENIKKEVVELNNVGISPTLGILRVGQNSDDIAYEKSILKNCDSVGIVAKVYELEESISTEGLLEIIEKLNQDMDVHGILIFRPLPKHIDEEQINNTISSLKDVDCMNPLNLIR